MNPKLILDGKYYNIFKATLLCQNSGSRDDTNRWYKSQSGTYFRTKIPSYKLNPTRDDEEIEMETDFTQMRKILEYCNSKAPYFGHSEVFHTPEEFQKIIEV
tara:strand:+ start:1156 stop:1461 length:306 start_codon:yes stop_codon:yes gene_type:complete